MTSIKLKSFEQQRKLYKTVWNLQNGRKLFVSDNWQGINLLKHTNIAQYNKKTKIQSKNGQKIQIDISSKEDVQMLKALENMLNITN